MAAEPVDVNKRLIWSSHKLHRKRLIMLVLGTLAAAFLVWLEDSELMRWAFGAAGIVFLGFSFYETYRLLEPNAALIELLPKGVIHRVTTNPFIVPWHEIKGIDTIDVQWELHGRPEVYTGVTVLLVSKLFYDRVVHVDNIILRGPGWGAWFLEKDANTMQLALHHEMIPATKEEIRRQVEARWKVFGPLSSSRPSEQ